LIAEYVIVLHVVKRVGVSGESPKIGIVLAWWNVADVCTNIKHN